VLQDAFKNWFQLKKLESAAFKVKTSSGVFSITTYSEMSLRSCQQVCKGTQLLTSPSCANLFHLEKEKE